MRPWPRISANAASTPTPRRRSSCAAPPPDATRPSGLTSAQLPPSLGVMRGRTIAVGALLLLPIAGLVLVLSVPELDVMWEHQPSHFWLVLGVALVNVVLGLLASEAAKQRDDPRLFLVSMALLVSSGFLALHALATPGIVLHDKNAGFVIATPIGLLLASGFAAASAV